MSIPRFMWIGNRQDLREGFMSKFPNMDDGWTACRHTGGWQVRHSTWDIGEWAFGSTLDNLDFSLKYKAVGGLPSIQKNRSERELKMREIVRKK